MLHSIGKRVDEMWRLVSIRSCFSSVRKKYCRREKKSGKVDKVGLRYSPNIVALNLVSGSEVFGKYIE